MGVVTEKKNNKKIKGSREGKSPGFFEGSKS